MNILDTRKKYPLELKEQFSINRIIKFYKYYGGSVYISFSGGKDSLVLLHIVRRCFPWVEAVFVDTGLEFPEIREFVKTISNVKWIKPKMNFKKVIEKYGYPVVSKEISGKIYDIRNTKSEKFRNKRLYGDAKGNGKISEKWKYLLEAPFNISSNCCQVLKKRPVKKYEQETGKKPYIGMLAEESSLRKINYLQSGCNSFNNKRPTSNPLMFWTNEDIWNYIRKYNIKYSSIYDKGYLRTGCVFCMYGVHYDKYPNRFQKLQETHPKLYNYCMNNLGLKEVLKYLGISYKKGLF
jgi:3'-phosphoadenosine 5'-phosphosulfate sulfotransferase (PAPS reductase)/FAD synthetase